MKTTVEKARERKVQGNQRGGHGKKYCNHCIGNHIGCRGGRDNNRQKCIQDSDTCPFPGKVNHTQSKCHINRYNNDPQQER